MDFEYALVAFNKKFNIVTKDGTYALSEKSALIYNSTIYVADPELIRAGVKLGIAVCFGHQKDLEIDD